MVYTQRAGLISPVNSRTVSGRAVGLGNWMGGGEGKSVGVAGTSVAVGSGVGEETFTGVGKAVGASGVLGAQAAKNTAATNKYE